MNLPHICVQSKRAVRYLVKESVTKVCVFIVAEKKTYKHTYEYIGKGIYIQRQRNENSKTFRNFVSEAAAATATRQRLSHHWSSGAVEQQTFDFCIFSALGCDARRKSPRSQKYKFSPFWRSGAGYFWSWVMELARSLFVRELSPNSKWALKFNL